MVKVAKKQLASKDADKKVKKNKGLTATLNKVWDFISELDGTNTSHQNTLWDEIVSCGHTLWGNLFFLNINFKIMC
jgi:hypothetical protein